MAAQKFLTDVAGTITEKQAITTSAGAGDANKIVALNASGKLDASLFPAEQLLVAPASENLAAGDLVNVYDNAGALNVRKATNAAAGKEAWGYVEAVVTSPANATVFSGGANDGVTGRTVGIRQFLGVDGAYTETAPTASGSVVQSVGIALTSTSALLVRGVPITKV